MALWSPCSRALRLVVGFLILLTAGCYSSQVQFEWGWATQQVSGTITDDEGRPLPQKGFVVVQSYFSQFVALDTQQPLYYPQAHLIFPDDDGRFTVPFDLEAVQLDLNVIASGYVMKSTSFRRQIGMGDISYHVPMRQTAGWQDHLFVTIAPFLQQFILEQEFHMAQAHQLFLGEWLALEKAKHTPK